ncbi:hypothetical protein Dimus_027614 [Dionaea muscipula]
MVSSTSEPQNTKAVEATVGGLVWVRRRNGSWWPGQIMGLDEVSESCLASPKSGTPIKLLGRDDATVDWYNLEKSRRVKAFRCGEYEDCIEKARASAANSSKKAAKYARRENAILHALELESALASNDHENCSASDNADSEPCSSWPEVLPATSEHLKDSDCMSEEISAFEENSNSAQELSHSGISYEETNGTSRIKGQPPMKGRKQRDPNESDDEGSDRIKRMRGLDDLGRVGSSRKNEPVGLADAVSQGNGLLNNLHPVGSTTVNGSHDTMPSFKRKRSQLAHVHEFLKRKHRRRTLTKVLDTLVTVPIIFDESVGAKVLKDNEVSGVTLFNDDEDVGDLFDVPIDIEELHAGSSPPSLKLESGACGHTDTGQNCKAETISQGGNQAVNETNLPSAQANHVAQNLDESTSKWQMKGKRNSRHSSKTECLDVDRDHSNPLSNGIDLIIDPFSPSSNCYPYNRSRSLSVDVDGFLDRSKGISFRTGGKHFPDSPSLHRAFQYRLPHFSRHPPGFELPETRSAAVLYDVNIEVKASYRPQHVPYISLMSKLNGKAITGHPITVEAMEDGYCDLLLLDSSDYNPTSSGCEVGDDEDADKDYVIKPKGTKRPSPSKKHGPPSSKKTRRLSALTRPHRSSTRGKGKSLVQNLKGPTLACIPLKIVFSRINEALNGLTRR